MTHRHQPQLTRRVLVLLTGGALLLVVAAALALAPAVSAQESPLHPTFPLLDTDGVNVLSSGEPVSTMTTCGACHDTAFIAAHNAHEGILTGEMEAPAGETVMMDRQTGQLVVLDEAATHAEVNCFLCHTATPDNTARLTELAEGRYEWANTATLAGTGIVERAGESYVWNPEAFDDTGNLLPEYVFVRDPAVENCAQCHGVATTDPITPVVLDTCGIEQRMTITTGQVFSPQRIADSGLNIAGKEELTRTWDVHAERMVGCTDCHYAINNPAYATEPDEEQPEHLIFDPRRLEPGEYLYRPLHQFARSEADPIGGEACSSCHATQATHSWLPYTERHMEALACETCHVPRLELSARQSIDWTVLAASGTPGFSCRGLDTESSGALPLLVGYEPSLLKREYDNGETRIAPYNLITTFYWVYGEPEQPVPLEDLRAAYFDGDTYHPDVLAAFDADGNGTLSRDELVIDTEARQAVIAARLEALGLANPRIAARVDAYPIHHDVTHGDYATRDCRTCHSRDSRLAQPTLLADHTPGGVTPTLSSELLANSGEIVTGEDGRLYFQPFTGSVGDRTYIFGFSRSAVVDWIGAAVFTATLLGVMIHGGLRVFAARRRARHEPELRQYYMYSVYERLWHWLQTAAIMVLLFTGLIIHRPDVFGIFGFRYVVQVHNILAVILGVNAALAAFYHFASGEIRQFLPRPRGFFGQAFEQAKYYLQGIFRGDPHPFEKRPEHKLNPLQQIVYLGLLNVLLPLQGITGILIWGAQRWPEAAAWLGGLPSLAAIHALIAWLFAAFVVLHVYLTTTGPRPLASIRGMIMGWDEVEAPAEAD